MNDRERFRRIKDPMLLNGDVQLDKDKIRKLYDQMWSEISYYVDTKNGKKRKKPHKRGKYAGTRGYRPSDEKVFFQVPGMTLEPKGQKDIGNDNFLPPDPPAEFNPFPNRNNDDALSSYVDLMYSGFTEDGIQGNMAEIDQSRLRKGSILEKGRRVEQISNPHIGYLSESQFGDSISQSQNFSKKSSASTSKSRNTIDVSKSMSQIPEGSLDQLPPIKQNRSRSKISRMSRKDRQSKKKLSKMTIPKKEEIQSFSESSSSKTFDLKINEKEQIDLSSLHSQKTPPVEKKEEDGSKNKKKKKKKSMVRLASLKMDRLALSDLGGEDQNRKTNTMNKLDSFRSSKRSLLSLKKYQGDPKKAIVEDPAENDNEKIESQDKDHSLSYERDNNLGAFGMGEMGMGMGMMPQDVNNMVEEKKQDLNEQAQDYRRDLPLESEMMENPVKNIEGKIQDQMDQAQTNMIDNPAQNLRDQVQAPIDQIQTQINNPPIPQIQPLALDIDFSDRDGTLEDIGGEEEVRIEDQFAQFQQFGDDEF